MPWLDLQDPEASDPTSRSYQILCNILGATQFLLCRSRGCLAPLAPLQKKTSQEHFFSSGQRVLFTGGPIQCRRFAIHFRVGQPLPLALLNKYRQGVARRPSPGHLHFFQARLPIAHNPECSWPFGCRCKTWNSPSPGAHFDKLASK